jgi:sigma-54 dependent transcriptional regulator, acetoin dehydrogenase operon transcriptional activator AcoR
MSRAQLRADPKAVAMRRSASVAGRLTGEHRQVMVAWERFVSGENAVQGVPTEVLLSWHRCRDVHNVDPYLVSPPRAMGCGGPSLACNSVFAQLGGIAASIVERSENCLTTVTDGNGQILASWGSGAVGRRAAGSNLAPFFSWSESTIGTNGMGTALTQPWPMSVRGPEHWCQALHGWSCLGVAVYDFVAREAVAALNVSSWESPVPLSARQLTREMRVVHDGLRQRAWRDAVEVADAFTEASRIAHGALLAVDAAGNVIAANEAVRAFLGRLPASFALDPAKRYRGDRSGLAEIARRSVQRVQAEPQWVGSADLGFLLGGSTQLFKVRPVLSTGGVIGLILSDEGAADGETISANEVQASSSQAIPSRIVGMRDGRALLLSPSEIRYAEARRHDVWLATDRGWLRAATHGLDNVVQELSKFGFVQVHRSYVVNVARICEIEHHGKGILTLSTHPQKQEAIPVSRRYTVKLRSLLGL